VPVVTAAGEATTVASERASRMIFVVTRFFTRMKTPESKGKD
jgi:hypothetical protein